MVVDGAYKRVLLQNYICTSSVLKSLYQNGTVHKTSVLNIGTFCSNWYMLP